MGLTASRVSLNHRHERICEKMTVSVAGVGGTAHVGRHVPGRWVPPPRSRKTWSLGMRWTRMLP